jgi:hypothetical protein
MASYNRVLPLCTYAIQAYNPIRTSGQHRYKAIVCTALHYHYFFLLKKSETKQVLCTRSIVSVLIYKLCHCFLCHFIIIIAVILYLIDIVWYFSIVCLFGFKERLEDVAGRNYAHLSTCLLIMLSVSLQLLLLHLFWKLVVR